MNKSEEFTFTRETNRDTMETDIGTGGMKCNGTTVLQAGFKKTNMKGIMQAYVILDKNDQDVADYFLDMIIKEGTINIQIR